VSNAKEHALDDAHWKMEEMEFLFVEELGIVLQK
jgi:hypothetical protein